MRTTILALITLATLPVESGRAAGADWKFLSSPDGEFRIGFSAGENGRPMYRVDWGGREIIAPSGLGFVLEGGTDWTTGFQAPRPEPDVTRDSTWTPVWGERSTVRNHFRGAKMSFMRADKSSQLEIKLDVRAYKEGVAFRYAILGEDEVRIKSEETEFTFAMDHELWAVYSAQGKYSKEKISELKGSVERPCVVELGDGKLVAIAEAGLVDFSRMRLKRSERKPNTLVSSLHAPVDANLPLYTPWRVVMAASSPGELLENNDLLLNLNQPNSKITNFNWIRPGKVIREVSLSTEGGLACVDFAVRYGLQFIEFDAGWYGPERDERSDARTVSRKGLDLPKVIEYAKEHDVGVILYVNRIHLERDLDDLLPLYKEWGIAGIKFGFVRHGHQKWTAWLHEAIAKCAEYEIMVDVHDEYRMTGWQRTFPNFMTAEGIGGDETRPTNEQALINLFTRMIASPADHTFCYYNGYVNDATSHAAQLAKMVCFFSPWQFVFWYDRPSDAQDEPELQFIKHLPTTWDETRVLHGSIGAYAAIARRQGDEWFIGCLNSGEARTLDLKLDFLEAGKKYVAHIHSDDANAPTRTKVAIEKREVDSKSVLNAAMSGRGGVALRVVPVAAP